LPGDVNPMMKTLIVGGLVLLAAVALAPAATADPVTCPDTDVQDDGFAYCHFDLGRGGRGCFQVNLSGANKHCT
jgi:hypothetical protein